MTRPGISLATVWYKDPVHWRAGLSTYFHIHYHLFSLSTSNSTMSLYVPVPKPTSRLARYRALSPNASIHVSPLQLGAMSIGDTWEQHGMGGMNKESSFKLLDAFYEAGGNFIDTANH